MLVWLKKKMKENTTLQRINMTFLYLSAEELLSEPWVLLHTQRWHLRPLPVVQHAKRAGERDAEDEPLQDRYWSSVQPQGKTAGPSFSLPQNSHGSVRWKFPLSLTAQSAQHGEVRNLPGPREGAGVWYWYDRLWWRPKLLQVKPFCCLFYPSLPPQCISAR